MKKLYFALLLLMFAFISCTSPFENTENGQIQLSFSAVDESSDIAQALSSELNPSSLLISVESDTGDVLLSDHTMDLIRFGNEYVTETLALPVGDYKLTKFMVLNESNEAIYATPTADSDLASLVNNPLPINFSIYTGFINKLIVEVLEVGESTAEEFGYINFQFDLVENIDILLSVQTFDSNSLSWSNLSASAKIYDPFGIRNIDLGEGTNPIRLVDTGETNYIRIDISSEGYTTEMVFMAVPEWKTYTNEVLIVRLNAESNQNTEPSLVLHNSLSSLNDIQNSIIGQDGTVIGNLSFYQTAVGPGAQAYTSSSRFGFSENHIQFNSEVLNIEKGTISAFMKVNKLPVHMGSASDAIELYRVVNMAWHGNDNGEGNLSFFLHGEPGGTVKLYSRLEFGSTETNPGVYVENLVLTEGETYHFSLVYDRSGIPEFGGNKTGLYINGSNQHNLSTYQHQSSSWGNTNYGYLEVAGADYYDANTLNNEYYSVSDFKVYTDVITDYSAERDLLGL